MIHGRYDALPLLYSRCRPHPFTLCPCLLFRAGLSTLYGIQQYCLSYYMYNTILRTKCRLVFTLHLCSTCSTHCPSHSSSSSSGALFLHSVNNMEAFASSSNRRAGVNRDQDGGEDAIITEGLATALQCFQDEMGEKLASLAKEQAALLAKLEASREASACLPVLQTICLLHIMLYVYTRGIMCLCMHVILLLHIRDRSLTSSVTAPVCCTTLPLACRNVDVNLA